MNKKILDKIITETRVPLIKKLALEWNLDKCEAELFKYQMLTLTNEDIEDLISLCNNKLEYWNRDYRFPERVITCKNRIKKLEAQKTKWK